MFTAPQRKAEPVKASSVVIDRSAVKPAQALKGLMTTEGAGGEVQEGTDMCGS
jgi:hypothetical protein